MEVLAGASWGTFARGWAGTEWCDRMKASNSAVLNKAGLNLQAVFNLDDLPGDMAADLRRRFDPARCYRQLILIGHGGKTLWESMKASGIGSANPIDDFSVRTVERWLAEQAVGRHEVIYPGGQAVGLQTLGKLAGWHHPSPFMVGINEDWGTWYAYRVVVLADSGFEPSRPQQSRSPCERCREKTCISSCPAGALAGGAFSLDKCVGYRKQPSSSCRTSCLARLSCPVGSAHRYCDEQIRHTYTISMQAIEQYY